MAIHWDTHSIVTISPPSPTLRKTKLHVEMKYGSISSTAPKKYFFDYGAILSHLDIYPWIYFAVFKWFRSWGINNELGVGVVISVFPAVCPRVSRHVRHQYLCHQTSAQMGTHRDPVYREQSWLLHRQYSCTLHRQLCITTFIVHA